MVKFVRFIQRPGDFADGVIKPKAFQLAGHQYVSLYKLPTTNADAFLDRLHFATREELNFDDLLALCYITEPDITDKSKAGLAAPTHRQLDDIPEWLQPHHFGLDLTDEELQAASLSDSATTIAKVLGLARPFVHVSRSRLRHFGQDWEKLTPQKRAQYRLDS